jgi:hypothetical protein
MRQKRAIGWLFVAGVLGYASVTPKALAESPHYLGVQACRECHIDPFRAWEKSGHARAMDRLPRDRKKDGRCLGCHATGYGEPASGGNVFENVQCEACHGPGSLYKSPRIMSKGKYRENLEAQRRLAQEAGLTPITEEVCLRCHGKERPEAHVSGKPFDYRDALTKVRHPAP